MSKRKIAAILAGTSAVGIINSGTSVAFASERENILNYEKLISDASREVKSGDIIAGGSVNVANVSGTVRALGSFVGTIANWSDTKFQEFRDNSNGQCYITSDGSGRIWEGTASKGVDSLGVYITNGGVPEQERRFPNKIEVYDANNRLVETKYISPTTNSRYEFTGKNLKRVVVYGAANTKYGVGISGLVSAGYITPTISMVGGRDAWNTTIKPGDTFDPLEGVSAKDLAGVNIEVAKSNISGEIPTDENGNYLVGEHKLTYTVRDSRGYETVAERKITVTKASEIGPTINAEDVIIKAGEVFNPFKDVTITDDIDVSIPQEKVEVIYSEGFDPKAPKVGNYTATYVVSDSDGNKTTKVRNIRVIKRNNNAPTIHGVENKTINVNEKFDPMHGVVADDTEDNASNITISVTGPNGHQADETGKYSFADEGKYTFTYTATDLDGNETVVERVITVEQLIDTTFRSAVWASNDLIMTGKMDILGTEADANMQKTVIVRDSKGQIAKSITTTNKDYNDGQTGFDVDFTKTDVFDGLKAGETYSVFVRGVLNGKTYEKPLIQNATSRLGVTDINNLEAKEFNDYKITFRTGANNQIQIVKANLADTQKPVINAPAVSVVRGDSSFNLKDGVTITDNVDSQEDLLARLEINEGNFDINQAGTYEVTYTVRDAAGNVSETVTRTVTVTPKTTTKPTIKGATDVSIVQGTAFNSKAGVTAESSEGEDLTSRIKVNGTVNVDQVGEQTITYTVTDRDNNTTTVTRRVTVTAKPAENKLPTINAPMRHEIYVGDNFDPLAIATAVDPEDGPITLTQKNIVFNKVNTQKPGEYQVKYEVTDTAGARRSKVITVVVKQRPATSVKPTITFPEKTVIQVGESFDPIKDVTATDYKGNPITVEMKHVSWNKVDTSKPGDYQVKYTVSDSEGNTKIAYRTVTVEGQAVTSKKPTIEYASNVVQTGTVFDPLAGVTAKDYKGQIINLTMSNVSWNKVDTNTPGTYQVKYTVVDSEGNRQIFYRDVTVQGSTVTPPSTDKKPVISFQDNIEISVGDVFNPLDGVTATDYNGQNITLNESNIAWNKVDTTKAGTYQVKYVVRDSEGNQKIAYRTVIVKGYTGLRGTASLQSVTIDKNTNTLRVIGNVDSLIHVVNDKESNVATIDSDVKYYLVAKDANGNEIFKNYMVRMNNGGSNSGFKVNNLSNEELNKIQEGNDVTLSIVVETLGTKGELTLNAGSLSAPVELVDTARNVKYTTYSEGNKVKISKSQNTVTLSEAEKVEVEAIEEAPKSEEVTEENTVVEEATEEVVTEENTVIEEATEEAKVEVISDEEILELESELLLEGDLIIE